MHLSAFPPIFVPDEFCAEIEQLSKAALMDMVWDLLPRDDFGSTEEAMAEFRRRREIILLYRTQAAAAIRQREKLESRNV